MSSIMLNKLNLRRVSKYAKASEKTVSAVADQAIEYWFENQGEIVLEELNKLERPGRKA